MAINKYMRAALKAISHLEIDVKTNYKLIRQLELVKKPHARFTYKTWEHSVQSNDLDIPLRVFAPDNTKTDELTNLKYPVIIFLHGGGWVTGELDSYERTCRTIARQTGHMLIAVDYRLAPENPFPAAFEDCVQAVRAILKRYSDDFKVILMGDSAGGNLAAAVSLYLRDIGEKTVDKQILIYPVTNNNHTNSSPFPSVIENGEDYILTSKHICDYMDLYCGETDRNNPYITPLLAEDFSCQPDTLIITAQYDPLRDEGEEYGRKLLTAGNYVEIHRIPDVLHGYFSLPATFSAVKDTYKIINEFLQIRGQPPDKGMS